MHWHRLQDKNAIIYKIICMVKQVRDHIQRISRRLKGEEGRNNYNYYYEYNYYC